MCVATCAAWLTATTCQAGIVAATGDSQTSAYGAILQYQFNRFGLPAQALRFASGGASAPIYTGQATDIHADPPHAHDFGADALNSGAGVVLFQLGVNDSFLEPDQFAAFQTLIGAEFDAFQTAGAQVIVGANLPVLTNPNDARYALADERVRTLYNPWLQTQAAERGWLFLDNYHAIQQQPGWQSWYSDDGLTPGYVHLYGGQKVNGITPGYDWLSQQYAFGVASLCAGDADMNGVVDGADYTAWADGFHQLGGFAGGDFNCDLLIDGADYTIWADNFSPGSAAIPVPEPASWLLLVVGSWLPVITFGSSCAAAPRQYAKNCSPQLGKLGSKAAGQKTTSGAAETGNFCARSRRAAQG
ncbi:MAG: SGNH/GDSL hydrolase family protein [Pirellulales bacterium]|nr:SGNH/GDSL hydrolase family protein [Pirellulales bacterium]